MKRHILSIFLVLYAFQFPAIAQSSAPNIIFILTDDQRWDALGYAGNEVIQTPEMDKLAREGIYFKNAFVTTPIVPPAGPVSLQECMKEPTAIPSAKGRSNRNMLSSPTRFR